MIVTGILGYLLSGILMVPMAVYMWVGFFAWSFVAVAGGLGLASGRLKWASRGDCC